MKDNDFVLFIEQKSIESLIILREFLENELDSWEEEVEYFETIKTDFGMLLGSEAEKRHLSIQNHIKTLDREIEKEFTEMEKDFIK